MRNQKENQRKPAKSIESACPENLCGECQNFGFEDIDGFGYCANQDIRTYCGGTACEQFYPRSADFQSAKKEIK